MMFGAAPISLNLIENLPRAGAIAPAGDQNQFQQTLVQTASTKDAVPSSTERAAPIAPGAEVQRAMTQTNSLGERILQNLSAVHRGNNVPPSTVGPSLVRGAQPGPAEQSLLQPGGTGPRLPAKANGADNFESMIATLQDVYNNVIQVSLVSKSTGSFSSSLNKLVSAS